jgi:hypothetical protein
VFLVVKTFSNLEQGIGEHATFWLYAGTYTVFLVVKTFSNLEQGIGEHATFWLYAGTL